MCKLAVHIHCFWEVLVRPQISLKNCAIVLVVLVNFCGHKSMQEDVVAKNSSSKV